MTDTQITEVSISHREDDGSQKPGWWARVSFAPPIVLPDGFCNAHHAWVGSTLESALDEVGRYGWAQDILEPATP